MKPFPDNTPQPQPKTRTAVCRSCGCKGEFKFAGTQVIPERVAAKLRLQAGGVSLWNCPNCGTTLSEMSLD